MIKHENTKLRKMSARIDEGLLEEFMEVLDRIGLDYTSAVRCFTKQTIMEGALPFRSKAAAVRLSGVTKIMSAKVDEETRARLLDVLDGIGVDYGTAVRMFACQTVADQSLPFWPGVRQG